MTILALRPWGLGRFGDVWVSRGIRNHVIDWWVVGFIDIYIYCTFWRRNGFGILCWRSVYSCVYTVFLDDFLTPEVSTWKFAMDSRCICGVVVMFSFWGSVRVACMQLLNSGAPRWYNFFWSKIGVSIHSCSARINSKDWWLVLKLHSYSQLSVSLI